MWVKGIDGGYLETDGSVVRLGYNNRAWVTDFADDESVYWAYWHPYLGGSLSFDVDLSEVDCNCASGIYLVQADDGTCSWGPKGDEAQPGCSRIEIMESNRLGFTTAAYPCEDGECESDSETWQRADMDTYGPGSDFTINTEMMFNVRTRFEAVADDDDVPSQLVRIVTTLT